MPAAMHPHLRSLRDRLWSLVQRRVVLQAREQDTTALDARLKETVEALRRQGMTPIEIRAEVAEAEENAERLRTALYENPGADEVQRLGDMMFALGKDLFPRGYVKDVYAWDDGGILSFAWVMEPEKLRRALPYGEGPTSLPFRGPQVTQALRRIGVNYDAFDYERGALHVVTFLEHIANSLWDTFPDADYFHATFIPTPGYPWPHDYYSARSGQWVDGSKRPAWLLPQNVVDLGMHIDSPGVDFCALLGPLQGYEMGAEVATWSETFGKGPFRQKAWGSDAYFIVTHAMGSMKHLTRYGTWEQNAAHINACGGLLFPSLAVGSIPAANFGPFIMVADVGLLLRSLTPYRQRNRRVPAYVYDTDVWTMTTGTFFKEAAVSAFEQLSGRSDWMYYLDMNIWPLGAPQAPEVHGPGIGNRIHKVPKLLKEVRQRTEIYRRGLSPEEAREIFERHPVSESKARYPYLEAKANGVMPMDSFPLAVAPAQGAERFAGFLDQVGFSGRLLTVELPAQVAEVMDPEWAPANMDWEQRNALQGWANLEYGWHVADAILDAGRKFEL